MERARLFKTLDDGAVGCRLCSHFCKIEDGDKGRCGVRVNRGGELFTLVYERVASMNLDPVEKKPLYHFMPGTRTFSFGAMGCNLSCTFCQNWSLSQPPALGQEIRGQKVNPGALVNTAAQHGAASISYTYSEPTVFFELMEDTARLALERGMGNIIVSNGFQSAECLERLNGLIHAANIDLKSFSDAFYRDVCGARLKPVLANLKRIKEMGWWLEVTTLVIPGLNDSREELSELAGFIAGELGAETPWHISRFHPDYRMTGKAVTPVATLEAAHAIGMEAGLKWVYIGNLVGHQRNSTYCPDCGFLLMDRRGFATSQVGMRDGACAKCGREVDGVGL